MYVDDDTMLQGASSSAIDINGLQNRLNCRVFQGTLSGLNYSLDMAEIIHLIPKTSSATKPNSNIGNSPHLYQKRITLKDTVQIFGVTINARLTFWEHKALNKTMALNMLHTFYHLPISRVASLGTLHHLVSTLAIPALRWVAKSGGPAPVASPTASTEHITS